MDATITDERILSTATTKAELATMIQLAIDLRGPVRLWRADSGLIFAGDEMLNDLNPDFKPFINQPTAEQLAEQAWEKLVDDAEQARLPVFIPLRPNMGGLGGWTPAQLMFWRVYVVCAVGASQAAMQPAA